MTKQLVNSLPNWLWNWWHEREDYISKRVIDAFYWAAIALLPIGLGVLAIWLTVQSSLPEVWKVIGAVGVVLVVLFLIGGSAACATVDYFGKGFQHAWKSCSTGFYFKIHWYSYQDVLKDALPVPIAIGLGTVAILLIYTWRYS